MQIEAEEVLRIAELANLELAPEEVEAMRRDLGKILEYIALLDRLPTAGVEPMSHATAGEAGGGGNRGGDGADHGEASALRADEAAPGLGAAAALANAPLAGDACFKVPLVIERG